MQMMKKIINLSSLLNSQLLMIKFMNIFKRRISIFLVPAFLWFLGQVFLWQPRLFFAAVASGILVIALSIKGLSVGKKKLDWPIFFYSPALVFASASLYETLLPNHYWIQALFLLIAGLIFSYLKNLYYFMRYEAPERAEKIDSIFLTSSVLSFFFLSASIYGLPTFLGWSFWPLLASCSIIVLLLSFRPSVVKQIKLRENWPLFVVVNIILLQVMGALYLLPLRFNVLGLLASFIFYMSLIVSRAVLKGSISGRALRFPLISGLVISIIVLFTARWF